MTPKKYVYRRREKRILLLTAVRITALICMIGAAGIPYTLQAQEFRCEVSVDDRRISSMSLEVADLGAQLERYLNENRWTQRGLAEHERIRCQIQILLNGADQMNSYEAEVVFHPRRPVYNTMRETTPVILVDNEWTFR